MPNLDDHPIQPLRALYGAFQELEKSEQDEVWKELRMPPPGENEIEITFRGGN